MQKRTLITGASSGIGLELARVAARAQNDLLLVARDKVKLHNIANELMLQGVDVDVLVVDLATPTAVKKIQRFCEQNNFHISTLINNAGIGDYSPFSKSDLVQQLKMIDLNIRSLTELTHAFLPAMLKQKAGKILNLGSMASFLPGPNMSVYYATKHYVLAFSESLAEELRGSGVSVTCLCPGPTASNFSVTAHADKSRLFAKSKLPQAVDVAEFGWYQMQQAELYAIYGPGNRLTVQLIKLLPRRLLARIVHKIQ